VTGEQTLPIGNTPFCVYAPQIVEEIVSGIVEKIPKPIDIREVLSKYPVLYEESMNTVLLQEVIR
jgi:dynein heavy chain